MTSDGDAGGNWIRMIPVFELREMLPRVEPTADLHANPYPNENAQRVRGRQRGLRAAGQLIGNPPGLQGGPGERA